jgi:hypothetical protein
MSVTIGTLNSTVEVTDGHGGGGGAIDARTIEQIVAIVLRRLKEEQRHEKRMQDETRIPDRMSEPTTD